MQKIYARLLRATLLLSSFLLLLLIVFPFCFVSLVYQTLPCLRSVTFSFEMKGWRQMRGWFSSLCRSLFVPFCSSLCFVLWSLSVYSLSIPLFIFLRPCSPRRNKENSLLFWFVLCLRFLPFVSVSWFFFQFSLCFLLPLHCFFRLCVSCSLPFVSFFSVPRGSFSLASSVSLRRNRGTKVCSWLSSRLCIMYVRRGKGVAQPETRLALLCWLANAPHCFFFLSLQSSLSVPLVLFSFYFFSKQNN